ncbi:c-type cytochrome [Viridibacterium curvum]|uniref:C-type cytochrome n=1 Tax=Viridibacterium curvum TaxID=1101404 RepID=A0ABP9QBN0_9RHOO
MIKRSLTLVAAGLLFSQVSLAETTKAPLDPAKAKQTAETTCGACHGADGNSVIPVNPSLAGQHPDYLIKQLNNFKSINGKPAERANPVMGGMAAPLSADDIKALAAYFSQQKLKPAVAAGKKESLELGQKIWRAGDASRGIAACAGCHGPAGAGIPAQYPRLSGQHAAYTEAQLKSFRDSVRANDPNGMMRTIALRMTEAEIKAVSDYAAGLR